MGIFSKKPKIDSRQQFYDIIRKKYSDVIQGEISVELLDSISDGVTKYYHNQYQIFRKQHPKSIKRYSTFHLKDLDHPNTHELVIKIIKDKVGEGYESPATKFLCMELDELKEFEKNREKFYKMF